MEERLKWTIIFGAVAVLLLGSYLGMGWLALILPFLWAVFVLWVFPKEEQSQSTSYNEDEEEDVGDKEDEEEKEEDEDEDEDEEEDEETVGWIVAYCPDCGKKVKHKVDLESRYARCTLCGRTWKYKGTSW